MVVVDSAMARPRRKLAMSKAPKLAAALTAQDTQLADALRLSLIEGLSIRAIARRLQLSRKTVRKLLGRATERTPPSSEPRASLLAPYDAEIHRLLADTPELKAPAILERLRPLGYTGGITILRDRVRVLRPHTPKEAFLTLDFTPGSAFQVDWADFGFALPGCPRRVSGFVMVACYSRYLYLEFTLSQAMGTFLRCMERGLAFFGGVATADIFDNMKTVVVSHTPHATVFNPRFVEYAKARGFAVVACNVKRANEKGLVERPIGFVRVRFWPGRRFTDLLDLNTQALQWRDDIANHRVHEVTGKVPALMFRHDEQRHLKPIPATPFDVDDLETNTVTKSFRVTFDRNRYSVPWRLASQSVLVRATDDVVGVFLGRKQVAAHRRSWGVGQDIEHPSHKAGLLEKKPRAAAGALPPGLSGLGQTGTEYFKIFAAGGRSVARETVRLSFLVELFGEHATCAAIAEVMATGHVGAEYVEYVLRHKKGLVPSAAPLRLGDPVLDQLSLREPDLSLYDQLIPQPMTRDPGTPATSDESAPGVPATSDEDAHETR
jgi:transposase